MKTVSDLRAEMEKFVTKHLQLKGYYTNSLEEMDIDKMDVVQFPFLYSQVEDAEIAVGYTQFQVRIIIADLVVEEQLPTLDDVYTDTLLIMQDLIASLYNTQSDRSVLETQYGIGMPVSCSPFAQRFNNLLTGWDCLLNIRIPNGLEVCNLPIAE